MKVKRDPGLENNLLNVNLFNICGILTRMDKKIVCRNRLLVFVIYTLVLEVFVTFFSGRVLSALPSA